MKNKILLMGNPNVGKSAIFSRLTGAKVIISNYPGTTIEFTQGQMKIGDERPMVIDVPGTYSLEPTCNAEEVAVRMLNNCSGVIINIIDATNLERNLYLTLQLLEKGIPMIVALNMWDDTKHKGIHIDVKKLEKKLGVPVIPTCGLTGEGINELVKRLPKAKVVKKQPLSKNKIWEKIGRIVAESQKLSHHHHTLLERLEDLSIKPLTGLPLAAGVIFCAFWLVRFIGENLINYIFNPLFYKLWLPLIVKLSNFLGAGTFLHNILIGSLINGKIDFGQSFGLLTTGFFVPIAMVLPYILSFYLILGFLEDFGYLPRLAVLVDNFMHHLGLHGYAIVPFILGLGCNVPGALAIRILEGRREKFIAATLMAIAIPCMAQIAMIIGLLGPRGGKYVAFVFLILFALLILKGLVLNKVLKGTSPELLLEIPPYRIPQALAVIKKLWMRLAAFLKEALPLVLLGVFLVNMLHYLGIMDFIAKLFAPVFTTLLGLPKEAISSLIVGFLRKDVAIGMLGPLNLTTKQLIIGSTILTIYFPCIATFVVLIRELGIKDMFKIAIIMITVALLVGTTLNLFL
ncbi:MAG: ferrous iron transporter B [Candidatus Omnitrophica bacterium]|nr:ferrous iron transporter B [Candidatus Omnitrophota bacterium]MBU1047292.1 ferrous iron transporter B [Candidatus Omnitrophota bacterium]MBU1630215.1 ferrous iron transporter B [Candidatus Omnitrophota bacterium]MBU1889123.1 ferrous iron transporter B [Candidatus Omnitrophota bacterium]